MSAETSLRERVARDAATIDAYRRTLDAIRGRAHGLPATLPQDVPEGAREAWEAVVRVCDEVSSLCTIVLRLTLSRDVAARVAETRLAASKDLAEGMAEIVMATSATTPEGIVAEIAALRAQVAELQTHDASVHKAVARNIAAIVEYFRRESADEENPTAREVLALAADAIERGDWTDAPAVDPRDAEIAELRATLANEQGQGEPPSPGWAFLSGEWINENRGLRVARFTHNARWEVYPLRPPWGMRAHAVHARDAMKAADAAKENP